MSHDDVIFETNDVVVYRDGVYRWKNDLLGKISDDLARELARLYQQLEDKEDDGK